MNPTMFVVGVQSNCKPEHRRKGGVSMTNEILTKGLKLAREQYLDLTLVKPEDIATMDSLEELMDYLYDADMYSEYVYESRMDD